MKIISLNVNGIRAAAKRGLWQWLKEENPEIACFQEIKSGSLQKSLFSDYFEVVNPAAKKGYSGTAVFSRLKPRVVSKQIGLPRFDDEGRILKLEFPDFTLFNLYLPHGSRDKRNLKYKLTAYAKLFEYLKTLRDKKLVICGDFNVAHCEIDLARPRQNQNNIMFTPEERQQLDKLVNLGFADSFRKFNQTGGNYTWWPYLKSAREKNIGWRIDYVFVSQSLIPQMKSAQIYKNIFLSDHCPIGIEINLWPLHIP